MTIQPCIVGLRGMYAGNSFPLSEAEFRIGRKSDNQLCLKLDSQVSQHHCRITCSDNLFQIEDLGSRNGTMVNEYPLEECVPRPLNNFDRVIIGRSEFLFWYAEEGTTNSLTGEISNTGHTERAGNTQTGSQSGQPIQVNQPYSSKIIGRSKVVKELRELIAKAAKVDDATVLILGETGTGKELIAKSIHFDSARASKPFNAINCAALEENLLEAELFGSVRGAFTGAVDKEGLLQATNGGTFFLDEIGEMKLSLQAKLLRALQERKARRVGATKEFEFDVRIIAATNRDLEKRIQENQFRADLYYRLNVITITSPPLRKHPEDILPLARHFLRVFRQRYRRTVNNFSPKAIQCLETHSWPGNVRELEGAIQNIAGLWENEREDTFVQPADLPDKIRFSVTSEWNLTKLLEDTERQHICKALKTTEGNVAATARLLSLDPSNLQKKIDRFGLRDFVENLKRHRGPRPNDED